MKQSTDHCYHKVNQSNNIEAVAIQVFAGNRKLTICQAYKPPNKSLCVDDLKLLFSNSNMVVMGDLNCKRKEWKCPSDNAAGKVLIEYCLDNNIIISSPQNFTNFPTVGRRSVLDIFLLKSNLEHSLPQTKCCLSSDHNPVEIFLDVNCKVFEKQTVYDYAKADWRGFKHEFNEKIDLSFHISDKHEVENKTAGFLKLITSAIKNNIPIITVNPYKCHVPKNLKILITAKKRLRKRSQKNCSPQFIRKHLKN